MAELYVAWAEEMLDIPLAKTIPVGLETQLCEVDKLARKLDGRLRSRQAVAIVVGQWIRENPVWEPRKREEDEK
jgi:hypothetical protein